MVQKIPTGVNGLDELLKGGVLPAASIIIEGTPGTGKSTLGMQFIAEGIKMGQHGILVTLEEYPAEFYRDALNYGWDFRSWEKEDLVRVVATSPEAFIEQIQCEGPLAEEIQTINAKRFMVDSITQFERISTENTYLRNTLSSLTHALKVQDIVSLFTKDTEPGPLEYWGRYSVDVLIELSFDLLKRRERQRFIEVRKARGQSHILGRHSFRITDQGIKIFPRPIPQTLVATSDTETRVERIKSGVDGFDDMLGGGYILGQSILLAGTAGTGKSLMSISFAKAGVDQQQRILYISMEDAPSTIIKNARAVGIDLLPGIESGMIGIFYLPPVELSPDELVSCVRTHFEEKPHQRLVIDSISALRGVTPEVEYLRDVVNALSMECSKRNVCGIFIGEIEEMTGPFRFTEFGGSFIADTVILLRQVEVSGELKKAVSVVKMRGSRHDRSLRELLFTSKGLKIGPQFENLAGLLTGTPTAERPIGVEPYFGEMQPDEQRVVDVLRKNRDVTTAMVSAITGLDEDRAQTILDGLADRGFVTRTQSKGEIRYRAALMTAR